MMREEVGFPLFLYKGGMGTIFDVARLKGVDRDGLRYSSGGPLTSAS